MSSSSSSLLPWKWAIESLADVPDVGTSILSALVDRFPDVIADSSSGAVRERLALRYLEECSGMACGETPPAVASNAPSTSASAAKIDAARTCEEVLRSKVATANGDGKGKAGLDGGDLHQFILLKRATLPKTSIDLLKEKILGSYHPDFSYLKECNVLPEVTRPRRVNHLAPNNHRDHDGIKKIIKTIKYASPWMKKLTISRKYRKLKNLTNNTLLRTVAQKNSSTQQHLLKQKVPDDDKRNQLTNVDGTCSVQFCMTEKTKTNTCEEFHDVVLQPWKDNSSGHVPSLNGDSDNFEASLRSGQQYQKQNVLHDDRADLQEVADGDCGDVQLLDQSSMPQSSSAQSLCIKCCTSGQLLNCSGDGCSRSFHESCLGLLASSSVEKNGLFYCPFCAYRNARMMYQKSKRKAEEAWRNLVSFYDNGPTVNVLKRKNLSAKTMIECDQANVNNNSSEHPDAPSNQQLRNSSGAQKHDDTQNAETSNREFARDNNLGITQNQQNQLSGADDIVCKIILPCKETIESHIHQDIQDTSIKLKCDTGREHESSRVTEEEQPVDDHRINDSSSLPCDVNTSHECNGDVCVTNSRNEVCRDRLQVEEIKNVHAGYADQEQISVRSPLKAAGECDHNAKRKALALQISDRFAKRNGRDKAVVNNQQTDSPSSRVLRMNTYRQNRCFTLKQSPSRRTKLIWKPEEEEILEEAMQKIPKNEDGSIPWIKILEYGRRFLHESRTPIDLKDKWRNMQKKEAKK